jgi:hypothetical protein
MLDKLKDTTITFILKPGFKDAAQDRAHELRMTLSEYIRSLIAADLATANQKQEA